ncbi:MAG: DUF1648 domain-containing protein, partial [Oscillospiraceae bacterium]|nr:DUF1648 domain-containing protein [Oscillospiraceae bacterium]
MLRNHKWTSILSSAAILLPILVGLLLWDQLPAQMVTHWGADGTPDGTGSRAFAVLGIPLILLAVHWFCLLFTAKDPASKKISRHALGIVFWICPLISISVNTMVYRIALGHTD